MYLQSDGSDRKKIHSRSITGASAVDECQSVFDPKVYSSAADSLSGDYDVYSESLLSGITDYFYPIIILNVIRTEP